ncbi:hypothetical protein Leryth_024750, partial [Lithospermum erythrorhizon]
PNIKNNLVKKTKAGQAKKPITPVQKSQIPLKHYKHQQTRFKNPPKYPKHFHKNRVTKVHYCIYDVLLHEFRQTSTFEGLK